MKKMGFSLSEIEGMTEQEIEGYVAAFIRIRTEKGGRKTCKVKRNHTG